MELSREAIVEGLQQILGAEHVVTDEQELRERSIDNFRKLETIFGVWTLPAPAAVARVGSTEEAAAVLAFATEHGINVVPRTGGTATEGGLETHVPNSIVLDGGRMDQILSDRRVQHAGHRPVRRAAAGSSRIAPGRSG